MFPEWAESDQAYEPVDTGVNAFDGYVKAARQAVTLAPVEAERVSFTEGAKDRGLKRLGPLLNTVARTTRLACEFEHRVSDPFLPDSNAKGWRLIGRGLLWKIESAVKQEAFDEAAKWVVVATQFGLDLTQGDSATASLGFNIVNDARRAFAPHYKRLSVSQLGAFHSGLAKAVKDYKGLKGTVNHEEKRMMLGVQYVQDCYQKKDFSGLQSQLGKDAKPAINYLKGLEGTKREEYFKSLSEATRLFVDHWSDEIDKPRPERSPWADQPGANVYKRIANAFWGTVEPMASMSDMCLAQTRILAVSAWARANARSKGAAKFDLKGLPRSLTLDPYSGRSLIYKVSGQEFKVYSVGADGRDDGGESDEFGQFPDTILEGSNL